MPFSTITTQSYPNITLSLFCHQTTNQPIYFPPHVQNIDLQKIVSINLKRTHNCQWGMPQANGHTKLRTVYYRPVCSKEGDIASHYNSCTNEVNETQFTALSAQEP
jgi:hypothetical protein